MSVFLLPHQECASKYKGCPYCCLQLCPIFSGGSLVIAKPHGHTDPAYMAALIRQSGVTWLATVPSLLLPYIEQLQPEPYASLRLVISCGELCYSALHLTYWPAASGSPLAWSSKLGLSVTLHACALRVTLSLGFQLRLHACALRVATSLGF